MAEVHKLAILRYIKVQIRVQKIWGVLIFLSIVTIIEVALGIVKPDFDEYFLSMNVELDIYHFDTGQSLLYRLGFYARQG